MFPSTRRTVISMTTRSGFTRGRRYRAAYRRSAAATTSASALTTADPSTVDHRPPSNWDTATVGFDRTLQAFCEPALQITRASPASTSSVTPTGTTCGLPSRRSVTRVPIRRSVQKVRNSGETARGPGSAQSAGNELANGNDIVRPSTVPARPAVVIGVLASCGLTVSLMQTLVVPLLPQFPLLLGASTATVAWLVTATLVAGAVCAPLLGRLGDMYGKRRMLLVALGLITVGSALGALAPGVELLIVARVLQGASLGVMPLGISVMRDVLPAERVGSGIALMSSSLGIGGAIGLPLTGLVAEHASWRWLFVGAAVLGALQTAGRAAHRGRVADPLRWPVRPARRARLGQRAGLPAAGHLPGHRVGLGQRAGARPAGRGRGCCSRLWGRYELRTATPLVDLRVSARPAVLWTNVASVLIGFAMFAGFLVTTQILQALAGHRVRLRALAAGRRAGAAAHRRRDDRLLAGLGAALAALLGAG